MWRWEAETEPVWPLKLKNIYYLSSTTNVATRPLPLSPYGDASTSPSSSVAASRIQWARTRIALEKAPGCRQATQRLLLNEASSIHLGPGSGTPGETCQGPVRWRNGAVSLEESEAQGCPPSKASSFASSWACCNHPGGWATRSTTYWTRSMPPGWGWGAGRRQV